MFVGCLVNKLEVFMYQHPNFNSIFILLVFLYPYVLLETKKLFCFWKI